MYYCCCLTVGRELFIQLCVLDTNRYYGFSTQTYYEVIFKWENCKFCDVSLNDMQEKCITYMFLVKLHINHMYKIDLLDTTPTWFLCSIWVPHFFLASNTRQVGLSENILTSDGAHYNRLPCGFVINIATINKHKGSAQLTWVIPADSVIRWGRSKLCGAAHS